MVNLSEARDESVDKDPTDTERLEKLLEIPSEEGDPGSSRDTTPLEPIPEPKPSEKPQSSKKPATKAAPKK